jgi:hypothetical protein
MSEHEQRDEPDVDVEREETIRDLDVSDEEAGKVSGGHIIKLDDSSKKN